MTKTEAHAAVRDGKKVRFKSWWWGRFLCASKGKIVDDRGVVLTPEEIFTVSDGWEIYDEAQHGSHNETR